MPSVVNPLRGLTMSRAVDEMENGQRGYYSHLQWLYSFIEKRDATLRGAKRRLLSSVLKLSWNIQIQSGLTPRMNLFAERQRAALKNSYQSMKGFRAALKHLALAEFRGFSHVEKLMNNKGEIIELQPVPQWHWCREGLYGDWLYQENAMIGSIQGQPIDTDRFIIREIEDPIDEIALICFTRKGLSQKDMDAYIARYGIPFIFWILPEFMAAAVANDPAKMEEFALMMRGIGSDGEGILPGGKLETLDADIGSNDSNPFLQHLGYQDEQIVMAATSGKLTMLNDATGIGGGNSETHQKTFDEIAHSLAVEVSESFHEQIDIPELARLFPGQEPLVYFELAAKKPKQIDGLVKNVKTLDDAGWQIEASYLRERTGYNLRKKGVPSPFQPNATSETPKLDATPGSQKFRERNSVQCRGVLTGWRSEVARNRRKAR